MYSPAADQFAQVPTQHVVLTHGYVVEFVDGDESVVERLDTQLIRGESERGPLPVRTFSGCDKTVARVLGAMGFTVRASAPLKTAPPQRWALLARPSRYRVLEQSPMSMSITGCCVGKTFDPATPWRFGRRQMVRVAAVSWPAAL